MNTGFYDFWQMPQSSGYGQGDDDGAKLTSALLDIRNAGGGTLRVHGSPVLDTPIKLYQGINLQFAGAMKSEVILRESLCGLDIFGVGVQDLGIGGFIENVEIKTDPERSGTVGMKTHGTRRHSLRQVVFSDLDVGQLITSRDDGDPDANINTFGGAFNYVSESLYRRCNIGLHIDKGPSFNNRNDIEAQFQSCKTGVLINGSGTNVLEVDCQGCETGVHIEQEDNKNSNHTYIHFTNENKNSVTQLFIAEGTKGTVVDGVYNKSKVIDNGIQTELK